MEDHLEELLGEPKGLIDKLYREWCISHPDKIAQIDVIVSSPEEIKEAQLEFVKEFLSSVNFESLIEAKPIEKSDDASTIFREQGNKFYQQKQMKAAIEGYNKAISFAVQPSMIALAYANRSAVFFQLNEYKACIRDVQRALESRYPDHLAHKLYDRKGKCCIKLGFFEEAIHSFEAALKFGKSYGKENIESFLKEVDKSLQSSKARNKKGDKNAPFNADEEDVTPMLTGVNRQMPSFSKTVQIVHSNDKGRHAVATRKIECGEVIMVEKSDFNFAALNFRGKVCTQCLKPAQDMIPSTINTKDVFCGEICKQKAMATYHPSESSLLASLEAANITQTEWHIVLRAVLSKPLTYFLENRKDLFTQQDLKYGINMAENQLYDSNDLKTIFNLQSSETAMSLQRLHFQAFVASFFLACMQKVNFFAQSKAQERDETYLLKLLMHLMSISNINAHEMGIYEAHASNLMEGTVASVGGSLSPAMVLLNHSCDPNTLRFHSSGATIFMANRTILEGEEICALYASTYAEKSYDARQAYLKSRYFFNCKCPPCINQWPTAEKLPKGLEDIKEDQLKIDTSDGMVLYQQMIKIQKLGSNINLEQKNGNFKKAFSYCVEFIKLLEETFGKPHAYYLMAEKTMFNLSWILHGSLLKI